MRKLECPPTTQQKVYPQWSVTSIILAGTVQFRGRRLLVEPEAGTIYRSWLSSRRQNRVNGFQLLFQFHALDYGMENSNLTLRILEYGSETIVITHVRSTIDVLSLAVGASTFLRRLSYRSLLRRIDTTTGK